jgi:hypothetical protein
VSIMAESIPPIKYALKIFVHTILIFYRILYSFQFGESYALSTEIFDLFFSDFTPHCATQKLYTKCTNFILTLH